MVSLKGIFRCSIDTENLSASGQSDRPWIWENFASHEEVLQAHEELEQLRTQGILTSANSDTTGRQKAPRWCLRVAR
eukprot:g27239.t1